jgi:hypothetical protein
MLGFIGRRVVLLALAAVTTLTVGCSRIKDKDASYQDESLPAQVDADKPEVAAGEQRPGEPGTPDAAGAVPEAPRAVGGGSGLNANAENVEAEALDLVRSVMGQFGGTPVIDDVSPAPEAGRVNVTGHFEDGTGAQPAPTPRHFRAVVDCEHDFVCSLFSTDPPIAKVKVIGNDSARAEGERFLREHFLEWSDLTRLTTETHKESGSHILAFANVLESGAWTGAWCAVIIDDKRQGVVSFVQQKALRQIEESDVKVSADTAEKRAIQSLAPKVAEGLKIQVTQRKLILSHHAVPDYGPVWAIRIEGRRPGGPRGEPASAPQEIYVDGMTGDLIPRLGQGPP